MYNSIDNETIGVGRRKCSTAVLVLAIAAAVLGALYIVFGFFISIYNSSDGYGFDFTHPNIFGVVDIALTLASLAFLILYATDIGRTQALAVSMLIAAAHILAGFVSVIVYSVRYQAEYFVDTSIFVSVAILFIFAFAGITLLKNPSKTQLVALLATIVLLSYLAMIVLNIRACIEYANGYADIFADVYADALPDYFIGTTIANSFFYISRMLMCICIVIVLQPASAETPE